MGATDPTNAEMMRLLERVEDRLDRLENKLDEHMSGHDERLRQVERWSYALPPTVVLAALSLGLTAAANGGW